MSANNCVSYRKSRRRCLKDGLNQIARRKNMAVRNVRRVSINIPRMPKNVSITDDHGNVLHRPGDQAARMTMPSNAIRESPTEPK